MPTHLEEREVLIEDCLAHRLIKEAEEGSLRAHADADICVPGQTWLRVCDVGDRPVEAE